MNNKYKYLTRVLVLLAVVFLYINTLLAIAFPFREFDEGDPVPDVTLSGFADAQKKVSFSGMKGKPFIAIFWGADLPEKIERSAQILEEVGTLVPFLSERQVQLFSVNAQGDEPSVIKEVVDKSKSTIEVYLDPDKKAYGTLGIFVMPTILLVDKDGNVAAGMGYSHDVVDRLKGAVEIMLGEKTAEQVQAELRPEMKEATEQEKGSRRHMDFGLVMLKRGQIDIAIRELSKAVEINPELVQAHIELGCIYLNNSQLDDAEKSITKALKSDPNLLRAQVCRAELNRMRGRLDEAAKELQGILGAHSENFDARYTLGKVYEDQKKSKESMEEYKKAYLLILKESVAGVK